MHGLLEKLLTKSHDITKFEKQSKVYVHLSLGVIMQEGCIITHKRF
jgi:hypothetical protein